MDDNEKIAYYLRHGWAPVSYKHLNPALRALIKAMGYRPRMKECFQNTQRIFMEAHMRRMPWVARLAYHEGWISSLGVPVQHAWLSLDGENQDPTLDNKAPVDYLASNSYTVSQVRNSIITTQMYTAVNQRALTQLLGIEVRAILVDE